VFKKGGVWTQEMGVVISKGNSGTRGAHLRDKGERCREGGGGQPLHGADQSKYMTTRLGRRRETGRKGRRNPGGLRGKITFRIAHEKEQLAQSRCKGRKDDEGLPMVTVRRGNMPEE